jgi:hypothetical protein
VSPHKFWQNNECFYPSRSSFWENINYHKRIIKTQGWGDYRQLPIILANNRFYLLSDDRSQKAPARFYRASLQINDEKIEKVNLEAVTFLKDGKGETFKRD